MPHGGVAHGLADLRIHHFDDDADEMARRAELRGLLLAAEVVDENFKQVALHVGVFAQQVLAFERVHRLAQRRAVRDDDGGIFKQGAGGGRERGVQREFREQGAERFEHPPVVGVGREHATSGVCRSPPWRRRFSLR